LHAVAEFRHDLVIRPARSIQDLSGAEDAVKGSRKPMSLVRQLQDYRLTTAEILYHLPDHPNVLQAYIWQELDIAPQYPVLHKFLDFWNRDLEGRLHSVRVASVSLIKPASVGHCDALLRIH
jgi:uncharacterized protein Usg